MISSRYEGLGLEGWVGGKEPGVRRKLEGGNVIQEGLSHALPSPAEQWRRQIHL